MTKQDQIKEFESNATFVWHETGEKHQETIHNYLASSPYYKEIKKFFSNQLDIAEKRGIRMEERTE